MTLEKSNERWMKSTNSGKYEMLSGRRIKNELTSSSSNRLSKTLDPDYLPHIANFFSKEIISSNTKCRKQIWSTDDEILPVPARTISLTLKFIFSSAYGNLFLVLFQANIYSFSF